MEYEVEGPRPRGRPKRTWREVVREDCQARKLNKEDAMDRCKWRKMIKDVRSSGWGWVGECFFWYWPTWVVPDKRPLNGCVCVCVTSYRPGGGEMIYPPPMAVRFGGSKSVCGRVSSLHISGRRPAAGSQRAYSLGSCVMQPMCLQPGLGQKDGRIAVSLRVFPYGGGHNKPIEVKSAGKCFCWARPHACTKYASILVLISPLWYRVVTLPQKINNTRMILEVTLSSKFLI